MVVVAAVRLFPHLCSSPQCQACQVFVGVDGRVFSHLKRSQQAPKTNTKEKKNKIKQSLST
jgi:hypothetical protein